MQYTRIIPRIDIKDHDVIKSICFEGVRVVGKPELLLRKYCAQGADEILYMDLVASLYRRNFDYKLLKEVTKNVFVPLTVGGGIRSVEDVKNALRSGADKVAINTAATRNPEFIRRAVQAFGSQCIVLSVEAKKIFHNKWEVYTDAGREKTDIDLIDWIKMMQEYGVGEIIISSVDYEGLKKGYELELLDTVRPFCKVPLVIHGGAGKPQDIYQAIIKGADGVCAASIYHYNLFSIKSVKSYLKGKKVKIRYT